MKLRSLSLVGWIACVSFTETVNVRLRPELVRPWSEKVSNAIPLAPPFIARMTCGSAEIAYIGDHHSAPAQTHDLVARALRSFAPELVIIELLASGDGVNPESWISRYAEFSDTQLLTMGWAGPTSSRLAATRGIPFMGGEPSAREVEQSDYLARLGYNPEDIRNFSLLRQIPFHPKLKRAITPSFQRWYRARTGRVFRFSEITREETAVNCLPSDTWTQRLACQINLNRDQYLVELLDQLSITHEKVLVVYGAGHFVQELPVFEAGCAQLNYSR